MEPLCKYFNICSGCTSQHIDYQLQLKNKKDKIVNKLKFNDILVFSENEYYYRNRMDFIFHQKNIGLRKKNGHIVDIELCVIAKKETNNLLQEVKTFFKNVDTFDIKAQIGTFRYLVIRTPKNDSSISFVLNSKSPKLSESIEKIKQFTKSTTAKNVIITYTLPKDENNTSDDFFVVKGNEFLKETYLEKEFYYSVQGFFQNNSIIAEKMQIYCNDLLKQYNTKESCLLDVYGGVGTFGIINSNLFKSVIIIENDKNCIIAAKKNIIHNKVSNVKVFDLDAKSISKLQLKNEIFMILDPPRTGLHQKTIEHINKLKPKLIIYISCSIDNLAKDIKKLKFYKIKSVALFDLFPQTNHCETIVELIKN